MIDSPVHAAVKGHRAAGVRGEAERRGDLRALISFLQVHETDLLDALREDLGKSPSEAFVSELESVRGECSHALRHLGRWMKPERRRVPFVAWPGKARLHREPCGRVLVIAPWNYPVHLSLTPVACALAAGCSVVLKPSERAPRVAEVLERTFSAFVAPDRVTVIRGDADVGKELLQQPFDHFFFTGSRETGLQVAVAAARQGAPATLELGGKCPVMIFSGNRGAGKLLKKMPLIARRIAWGKYLNAGQTCIAPDHVLVERQLYEPLVSALAEAFDSFRGMDYGSMVDRQHFDQVRAFLRDGTIAYGGTVDEATLKIHPTILTDIPAGASVMRQEVFGPILPVIPCDTLGDALGQVATHPDPLAVYSFTGDPAVGERISREVRSGAVCVNDVVVHVAGVDLPFGGVGKSGMGRYRGKAGFDLFTRERTVLQRGLRWEIPFRYPPLPALATLKSAFRWFR